MAEAQTEVVDDEIRILTPRTFDGLDPTHLLSASRLRQVGAAEGLFRIAKYGGIEAELASGYEMIDPATWLVHLRPGLTFWSGKALDARAAAASLERARQLVPFAASQLDGIAIEAQDERTLAFRSNRPLPSLPSTLAGEWFVIHNAESYGPQVNAFDLAAADLTGFFRVTAFEPGVQATLQRSAGYWGVAPRAARVRITVVVDPEARSIAALTGESHLVQIVSSASAHQIERSRSVRLEVIPTDNVISAFLNAQRPQLSDARVRQALGWAVDRDELVALAHDGYSAPVPSWLAADPLYPEASRVGFTKPDVARATQLLDDAGWRLAPGSRVRTKDGVPLRLSLIWILTYRPLAEVLQAQWGKIGVDVQVEGTGDSAFLNTRRDAGNWDAFIVAWGTTGDPAAVMSRHVGATGDINYAKLVDPTIENLLAGFTDMLDPEERRQQALKINARHFELAPFLPLTKFVQLNGVNRKLRNYTPHFLPWVYEVHPDLWAAV